MNTYDVEVFIDFCDNAIVSESLREGNSLKYEKLLKMDIPKVLKQTKKTKYAKDNMDALEELLILIDDAIDQLSHLESDMFDKALEKGSSLFYILYTIYRSRTLIGGLNDNWDSSLITKITRILIEETLLGLPVRKLSINDKKIRISKKIAVLRKYKEIVNQYMHKINAVDSVSEAYLYDMYPATEGLSEIGKTIAMGVQTLIYKIKILIQKIESWINEKTFQLFKSEYIKIDVDYYVQSMKLADQIKTSGNSIMTWLQIIHKSIDAINNYDNEIKFNNTIEELENIYKLITDELHRFESMKNSEIKIKPKDQQKLIAISSKDMSIIQQVLQRQSMISKFLMQKLIIYSRNLKNMTGKKEMMCKVISANFAALTNLQTIKSNMCVKIINGIITNGTYINQGNKAY